MKSTTTKRLCRTAVIAALYTTLTYVFMPLAFGPVQVRPAEALCILPLFYVEAIPALAIGCMLSNLASPFLFYDVVFGSLTTLLAAFISYLVGRFIKNEKGKIFWGGFFPVFLNAFILPLYIVFLCGGAEGYSSALVAYFSYDFSLALTQSIWVYGLGVPLYKQLKKLRKKSAFFE